MCTSYRGISDRLSVGPQAGLKVVLHRVRHHRRVSLKLCNRRIELALLRIEITYDQVTVRRLHPFEVGAALVLHRAGAVEALHRARSPLQNDVSPEGAFVAEVLQTHCVLAVSAIDMPRPVVRNDSSWMDDC